MEIEGNKKIYLIPNVEKTSTYGKIVKKLEKEKTRTEKVQIVLSKKVKEYGKYFKDCKIVDGKSIFWNQLENILEKILQEKSLALQDIYVLTNHYQEKNISLIRKLSTKAKTVNVITKEIQKYRIIEEMTQERGLQIIVANNKRKSLKKAKIIINLDFSKEELENYIICRNAIIINLTQEKLMGLKGFAGITIRDIRNRTR